MPKPSILKQSFFILIVLGAQLTLAACTTPATMQNAQPQILMNAQLEDGADFQIRVTGLKPRETIRLHGLRKLNKWVRGDNGQWLQVDVPMHAWADFVANRQGEVTPATQAPLAGTWRDPGTLGLFWAGYRTGSPELSAAAPDVASLALPVAGITRIAVTRQGQVLAQDDVRIVTPSGVTTRVVREEGLVGVFAAPDNARKMPVIVLLHGSEGGKLGGAASDAARFAAKGYAVLAITYFSYPYEAITGTPSAHVNIPIETIEKARTFLASQPQADVERFGVYGVSKGAEFAALAASKYSWIDAVVPCVGSDVSWEGYGIDPRPNPPPSSWSWQGQPIPAITLIPYVEGDARFKSNTDRYNLSRAQNSAEQVAASRIPIENSSAQFLFLGGDRDRVWASGAMSTTMHANLRAKGKAHQSRLKVYPRAGHNICGSGLFPVRLYSVQGNASYEPDLVAEGEATVASWRETKAFFARALGGRRD